MSESKLSKPRTCRKCGVGKADPMSTIRPAIFDPEHYPEDAMAQIAAGDGRKRYQSARCKLQRGRKMRAILTVALTLASAMLVVEFAHNLFARLILVLP